MMMMHADAPSPLLMKRRRNFRADLPHLRIPSSSDHDNERPFAVPVTAELREPLNNNSSEDEPSGLPTVLLRRPRKLQRC